MKKFKAHLYTERNELKFDFKKKLTLLLLIVLSIQINAKVNSLESTNSLEIENVDMQEITVKGNVTDEYGTSLVGVSVIVKGTVKGVSTDFDGNYTINISDKNTTLVFSYLGFATKEVLIKGRTTVNVELVEEVNSLDEVVVVGYGVQKKKDLVGAISQVKGDDLILSSAPSVGHVLQGRAAGLEITQNSAQPGGGLDFVIRGAGSINASNSPLIIVDGFPLSDYSEPADGNQYSGGTQGILNSFNPNDIESVEILKDASASAIYGVRAANGVVIITTKKGKAGQMTVDYSTSFSFQSYEDNYDILSTPEYMQLRNEAAFETWAFLNRVTPFSSSDGTIPSRTLEEAIADPVNGVAFTRYYSDDQINNAAGTGTNWFDLVTRDGSMQQHNLSLRGGTESTKYFLSGNFYEHKGVLKNSGFERASFRINLDQKLNDVVSVGLNFTKSRINNDNTQLGGQAFENSGLIRSALQYSPLVEAIDEDGNYPINLDDAQTPNPFSLLTITDEGKTDRTLANFYLEVKPLEGLVARFQAGLDQVNATRNTYLPRTTLAGAADNGRASISSTEQNDKVFDFTLTYSKTLLEDHKFKFLAGYSYQQFEEIGSSIQNTNFITDSFLWHNMNGGAGPATVNSSKGENELASFFGRLNYTYKDRYILTATIRRDGSGIFFPENQYEIFPSIAVGWNIAEEPFMQGLDNTISQFKLRYGYGEVGNQDIGGANAFAAYETFPAWLTSNEDVLIGAFLSRLENPALLWETTKEHNIGLDFGFLNNRISGSFEYYDKKVSDLLSTRFLNSYHALNTVDFNIGTTQVKGAEFTLNSVNIQSKDFTWKSTLTYATYDARWLERVTGWTPQVYESVNDPINAQFSYLSDGIMQVGEDVPAQPGLFPGMIKLQDLNGFERDNLGNPVVDENGYFIRTGEPDGQIDDADQVLLGSTDPDFLMGFTNMFTYKNFQLNFHFNGMFGRQIVDATEIIYGVSADGVATNGVNALSSILDRWTVDNPSTTRPASHYSSSPSPSAAGDFFLQDAWFIRLSNVSLAYKFPQEWFGKKLTSASLRLDAQNLFVITPYTGVDPETNGYDPDVTSVGNDPNNLVASYPNVRTFTIGLDLKF